ncbi:MAG: hypothetical protein HFH42_07285 [Lachnospiraceae bacterium]|jgi:mannitol-specific phosphotransferase system IIBC component|nr:hypothetical protein [Lachnospiraceae bacterium]
MKTKQVPIIIALIAGLTICIIGFVTQMETGQFVKIWAAVLVSFYILGCIAKLLLDKNFKEEETEEATDEAAEGEEAEATKEAEASEGQEGSAEEEKNKEGGL